MDKENAIILFKEQKIRATWHEGKLSKGCGQIATPLYFQSVTICHGLKLQANMCVAELEYRIPTNDNYLPSPDEKKVISGSSDE